MGQNCAVDPSEVVTTAPPQVGAVGAVGARTSPAYRLADDLLAVHRKDGSAPDADVLPVGSVAPDDDAVLGPVYRRVPGPEVVVPTGRVLVRFADGEDARSHSGELATAGYRVEDVPRYAAHAVWVRAANDEIVDALRHLDRLAQLPGVQGVEPEMIGARAWRS
jgi:hypothetical protein